MVIVNLGRKKRNHTHRGKKSPDASTKMHSPFLGSLHQLLRELMSAASSTSKRRAAGQGPAGALGRGAGQRVWNDGGKGGQQDSMRDWRVPTPECGERPTAWYSEGRTV